jgi:hypothetical protein
MPKVRYVRFDKRLQLRGAKALGHSGTRDRQAAVSCAGAAARDLCTRDAQENLKPSSLPPSSSDALTCAAVRSAGGPIVWMIEIVVKNLTMSYASRKPRVTYGRFAGDFERRVRQSLFESHVNTCEGKCVENAVALPSSTPRISNAIRVGVSGVYLE